MKKVAFILCFVSILSKPILYVKWLSGFPFCEVVILYSLLFQFKLHPFLHPFFLWLCLTYSLKKIETLSNSVDVRLVSCLIKWMIG